MKKSLIAIMISVMLLMLLSGCDSTEPKKSAHFYIATTILGTTSYGCPYVQITVENNGKKTGYNVSCNVNAKYGDTIIDTGFAYFANGGDIDPGESATETAIFFDLSSHNQYSILEYELDWLD